MEVTAETYLGSNINDAVVFVPAYFMLQAQIVSNHRKTSLHMDSLVTLGFYKGIAPAMSNHRKTSLIMASLVNLA